MKKVKVFALFAAVILVIGAFAGCSKNKGTTETVDHSYNMQDKSGNNYSVKVEMPESYSVENPTSSTFVVLDGEGKEVARATLVALNTYKSNQTAACQLPSYQQLKTGNMEGFSYATTNDVNGENLSYRRLYRVGADGAIYLESSVSDDILATVAQSLSVKSK